MFFVPAARSALGGTTPSTAEYWVVLAGREVASPPLDAVGAAEARLVTDLLLWSIWYEDMVAVRVVGDEKDIVQPFAPSRLLDWRKAYSCRRMRCRVG